MRHLAEQVVKLDELQVGDWDFRRGKTPHYRRLKRSIEAHGVIEPLLVREKDGALTLLDGHRRYRIAQELGIEKVPVLIVEGSEDELKRLVAVRNNHSSQHNGLAKAREAISYSNSGLSLKEIAMLLGCTTGYVSDLINILRLGKEVVAALEDGKITIAHARLLLRAESARREELLAKIVERGLNVAQTKALIEGRAVLSVAELNGLLPPGVSLGSGNGSGGYLANIVFSSADELRSQLRAILGILQGVDRLQEEPPEPPGDPL